MRENPKVFISYSWSSDKYKEMVRKLAERLISDGIQVILDIWDLKAGQDKYVFMEKLVNDDSVTSVLILCDAKYTNNANSRKGGVGEESQIISQDVYSEVNQTKFIPVVMERDKDGKPFLPTYLRNRIYIDYSNKDTNSAYIDLLHSIYDIPIKTKPPQGTKPSFLLEKKNSQAVIGDVLNNIFPSRQVLINGQLVLRSMLDAMNEVDEVESNGFEKLSKISPINTDNFRSWREHDTQIFDVLEIINRVFSKIFGIMRDNIAIAVIRYETDKQEVKVLQTFNASLQVLQIDKDILKQVFHGEINFCIFADKRNAPVFSLFSARKNEIGSLLFQNIIYTPDGENIAIIIETKGYQLCVESDESAIYKIESIIMKQFSARLRKIYKAIRATEYIAGV